MNAQDVREMAIRKTEELMAKDACLQELLLTAYLSGITDGMAISEAEIKTLILLQSLT
jgi:hypothetical protein